MENHFIEMISCQTSSNKITTKTVINEDSEDLFIWFFEQRCPILQVKALEFYKAMHPNTKKFNASKGWLDKFKRRCNIHQFSMRGEKFLADQPTSQRYMKINI